MGLTVNKQQVENIINSLQNTVKSDHVGSLSAEGTVTQTTSTWGERVCHFFKTLFKCPDIVNENKAILNSYKNMLSKNLGEVYSNLFSTRMRKVEDSGSYTIGKELSNQLRSIVTQYNADFIDDEKIRVSSERAYALVESQDFLDVFNGRFEMTLKAREIPRDSEGLLALEMDVAATRLFRNNAQDFILRNDRYPDEKETNDMLDKALFTAFKDVNKKNCEFLCANYKFIDKNSNESMDVQLKSALAARDIKVDVPSGYMDTLIGEVKEKMRGFSTYVLNSDVKAIISSVIKNAVAHEFTDKNLDKILTKNTISANVNPRLYETTLAATNSVIDALRTFVQKTTNTDEMKNTLYGICSTFHQTCNDLPAALRPNREQQEAMFTAAVKSATEFSLLDTPNTLETRNSLLNHSNILVGSGSPFATIMHMLSTGISANTDANAAKMLTFCRTLVSSLNEAVSSAADEAGPSMAELGKDLEAKKKELADGIAHCKDHMWENPTRKSEGKEGTSQYKISQSIRHLNQAKRDALANTEATQEQKDAFVAKIDQQLNEIRDMAPSGKLDVGTERTRVKQQQKSVNELQDAIAVLESKVSDIKKRKSDEGGELVSTEATLSLMRSQLRAEQKTLAVAVSKLEEKEIEEFNAYIDDFSKDGEQLQKSMAALQGEIDEVTQVQDTIKKRINDLNTRPENDESAQIELTATTTALQSTQLTLSEKTEEMKSLAADLINHTQNLQTASSLQQNIASLQQDIASLQKKLEVQPLSDEERASNSVAVKYLATGKDFGGLLNYASYKNVHSSIPMHNDVGLTQPEKNNLKQFMSTVVNENARSSDTVGVQMDKRVGKLKTQTTIQQGNDQNEQSIAQAQRELRHLDGTKETSIFLSTQHYTPAFVRDFENGLEITVNGTKLSGPHHDFSDPRKATSYDKLSNMFENREIAGKVLSPFSLQTVNRMFNALTGSEKTFPNTEISNDVLDYHVLGDSVSSTTELNVEKLDNGQYAVTCYASGQKDNGTYSHHMFKCIVSDLDKAVPTYTVDDVDVTYHVVSSNANVVQAENNNAIGDVQENQRTLTGLMQARLDDTFKNLSPQTRQALTRYLVDMSDVDGLTSENSLQAMAESAIQYVRDNPGLPDAVKQLTPIDLSPDDLKSHAQYIADELQTLCANTCKPDDNGLRPQLDEQGFYDIALKDCHRDLPSIAGVRVVSGQPEAVQVQDFKNKMLQFSSSREEREVLSILLSQEHLMIPGRMLSGIPGHLPFVEEMQPGAPLRLEPSNAPGEVRYQLERNLAGDAVLHVTVGIQCTGILGDVIYTSGGLDGSKRAPAVGTLTYDVLVPHNQFGLQGVPQGTPPVILLQDIRISPAV